MSKMLDKKQNNGTSLTFWVDSKNNFQNSKCPIEKTQIRPNKYTKTQNGGSYDQNEENLLKKFKNSNGQIKYTSQMYQKPFKLISIFQNLFLK